MPPCLGGLCCSKTRFTQHQEFVDLSDARVRAETWCTETAGLRIQGTTQCRPIEAYRAEGLPLLLPLPGAPFDTPKWSDPKVAARRSWSTHAASDRSGVGITADGALVYVGSPGLNITDLANLLVRAGAVRAMELDINTDWVNYSVYKPDTPNGPASGTNGTELLPGMTGTPERYFEPWWARDFFTMSAAVGG